MLAPGSSPVHPVKAAAAPHRWAHCMGPATHVLQGTFCMWPALWRPSLTPTLLAPTVTTLPACLHGAAAAAHGAATAVEQSELHAVLLGHLQMKQRQAQVGELAGEQVGSSGGCCGRASTTGVHLFHRYDLLTAYTHTS